MVGHATHHPGDVLAQLRETLTNLEHVLARASAHNPSIPPAFGAHSALKVYLRERSAADARQRFGDRTSTITIISVVAVVGQLIDAGRLPADCLDELVLGDGDGCTAEHALDRLQRFAASLPPGEARTTVDDVIHVFLNAPAVALMCE